MTDNADYLLNYLTTTPRYRRKYPHFLIPRRVYPDPCYPQQAAIVELPFPLDFRCERIHWETARLSHRLPIYQADQLGFIAVFRSLTADRKKLFDIVFAGAAAFVVWQKWLYFVDPQGKNLLAWYYQGRTIPPLDTYEQHVLRPALGAVFAGHTNLDRLFRGLTV